MFDIKGPGLDGKEGPFTHENEQKSWGRESLKRVLKNRSQSKNDNKTRVKQPPGDVHMFAYWRAGRDHWPIGQPFLEAEREEEW